MSQKVKKIIFGVIILLVLLPLSTVLLDKNGCLAYATYSPVFAIYRCGIQAKIYSYVIVLTFFLSFIRLFKYWKITYVTVGQTKKPNKSSKTKKSSDDASFSYSSGFIFTLVGMGLAFALLYFWVLTKMPR